MTYESPPDEADPLTAAVFAAAQVLATSNKLVGSGDIDLTAEYVKLQNGRPGVELVVNSFTEGRNYLWRFSESGHTHDVSPNNSEKEELLAHLGDVATQLTNDTSEKLKHVKSVRASVKAAAEKLDLPTLLLPERASDIQKLARAAELLENFLAAERKPGLDAIRDDVQRLLKAVPVWHNLQYFAKEEARMVLHALVDLPLGTGNTSGLIPGTKFWSIRGLKFTVEQLVLVNSPTDPGTASLGPKYFRAEPVAFVPSPRDKRASDHSRFFGTGREHAFALGGSAPVPTALQPAQWPQYRFLALILPDLVDTVRSLRDKHYARLIEGTDPDDCARTYVAKGTLAVRGLEIVMATSQVPEIGRTLG